MRKYLILILLTLPILAFAQQKIGGRIVDSKTKEPLVGAVVNIKNVTWTMSNNEGYFSLTIPKTKRNLVLTISCLGYKAFKTKKLKANNVYKLELDLLSINEVLITATEGQGMTARSRIRQEAIEHIQPSSFADLLELIPGGRAKDPYFGGPQIINLRSANSRVKRQYGTSSLGTKFVVDGQPIMNDANMQKTPAISSLGNNYVNLGVDMRSLTTEDIDYVDIVRGIASVKYGDLTSGLINIKRKMGGKQTRLRFKGDQRCKLVYVGQGFEWGKADKLTMNISANFLNSYSEPRNPRLNYKRATASLRIGKTWAKNQKFRKFFSFNIDYTGSFDNQKHDKNLDEGDHGPVETYKSYYNRIAIGSNFTINAKKEKSIFKSFETTLSLSYNHDIIDRWKRVALALETPISISLDPGVHDAIIVPVKYDGYLKVDGQPFYAYLNSCANFAYKSHNLNLGVEWNMDKNFGKGTIFNPILPFDPNMDVRPRPYYSIPANHQLALFIEENSNFTFAKTAKFSWQLGLRINTLSGAGNKYTINWKPSFDPRFNLRLDLPLAVIGSYKVEYGFYAGIGWQTKMPTMNILFPEPLYRDKAQLNYWPATQDKKLRRINLMVYKLDPINFDLAVANNMKIELGTDLQWNGFSYSINYFYEDMKSGFRNNSYFETIGYKSYETEQLDIDKLTAPPSLEDLPYKGKNTFVSYHKRTNGSQTLKQGVEFSLTTKRFPVINTRIILTGAWFLTTYRNSIPEYYQPTIATTTYPDYPFIGLYKNHEGTYYDAFNTNIMFDTQIPSLGLIFSTSFQAMWFSGSASEVNDQWPIAYLDKQLISKPFKEEDKKTPVLSSLRRPVEASAFEYIREPFSMNINLKVMKKLYKDKLRCSLFVNKIFDVYPDFERYGAKIRRSVLPYFGMELDFRL